MPAPTVGLRLRLLGPFDAQVDGVRPSGLDRRNGERLLAFLAVRHEQRVPREVLERTFWAGEAGDDHAMSSAYSSLRKAVDVLRDTLGDHGGRLEAHSNTLRFDCRGADVDVALLDRAGDSGDLQALEEAIHLCKRGPLLEGWSDAWVLTARRERRETFLDALGKLAAAATARADYKAAASYLRWLVNGRPSLESAWCDLLEALVRCEERADALQVFEKCRDFFFRQYKLPPPARATELRDELRRRFSHTITGPVQEFAYAEAAGGAVPLESRFYVERAADTELYAAISRDDGTLLVQGPRQIGKTSLLARGLARARRAGGHVILTDLQKLPEVEVESPAALFLALAQSIAVQLDLPIPTQAQFSTELSPTTAFDRYLRRQVLAPNVEPLWWAVDGVDRLFPRKFCGDVFALLRSWHNERALDPDGPWRTFHLALAYATEAHLFITNLNQSPFNVGTLVTLRDFTRDQVYDLNGRHGAPLQKDADLDRLYELVGGHPYLVAKSLYEMRVHGINVDALERQALRQNELFASHLDRMLLDLSRDTDLSESVRRLLRGGGQLAARDFFRLRAAGVVSGDGPQDARVRCNLYAMFLADYLQ